MPQFTGFSHLGLTVSDVEASKQWYADVLGWQMMMEGEEEGINFAFGFAPDGIALGLRQHAGTAEGGAFTPERLGLDHASFAVASRDVLEEWVAHFEEKGVTCSPIVDAPYGAVLSFKDPDGIALEAFAFGG
jgi:catechol 2,3-dioxygenase-like lactoylglutathione lyase family enzyme